MASETLIPLGQLVNVHATHGELRLRPFNPQSTTLRPGLTVVLRRGHEQQQRRIAAVRPHKHFLLLTLDGCTSMTEAEALIGHELCVREDDLPPAGPNEVYHYELIGMTVVTTSGTAVGTVAAVLNTPGNDVCVVRADGREYLIPFVAEVINAVDRQHGRLVIEALPGLLDE